MDHKPHTQFRTVPPLPSPPQAPPGPFPPSPPEAPPPRSPRARTTPPRPAPSPLPGMPTETAPPAAVEVPATTCQVRPLKVGNFFESEPFRRYHGPVLLYFQSGLTIGLAAFAAIYLTTEIGSLAHRVAMITGLGTGVFILVFPGGYPRAFFPRAFSLGYLLVFIVAVNFL